MKIYKTFYVFIPVFCWFFAFIPQSPAAQSASIEMDTLLQTETVTYAQAVRFVLEASDKAVFNDTREAFDYAQERKWIPRRASLDAPARLDGVALLFMRSFDMKGGMMYTFTKTPRYAYREMTYRSIIQGRSDPSMKVSGEQLLFIAGRMLSYQDRALIGARQIPQKAVTPEKEPAKEPVREPVRQQIPSLDPALRETIIRREALAATISMILEEQNVRNTKVEATNEGVMITLSDFRFMTDSAVFYESEKIKLDEIAIILRMMPGIKLQIADHATLSGSEEWTYQLSEDRAKAVADYLVSQGACGAQDILIIGFGAERPTAEGMPARRVEITILEEYWRP